MGEEVKIVSWNVWGLGISKKRKERIQEIGEHLKSLNADVIFLQELWKRSDYEKIKEALGDGYKSIRFEGGLIGCGLAVFSKLPLVSGSVGFQEFSVRGRMWRFWEGDWFTGKGFQYLSLHLPNSTLPLHIVNTHLQASYGGKYAVERAVQLLEIAEHLKDVKTPLYVLAGDLNTQVGEKLPWALLKNSLPLLETNVTQQPTCNVIGNTWTGKKTPEAIDHILTSPSLSASNFIVEDIQNSVRMSLSDHSLIKAELKASNVVLPNPTSQPLDLETVVAVNEALGKQIQHLRRLKTIWSILSGLALLVCVSFAIAASVLAMSDPGNATALTVIMAVLSPLGAALSLLFLAFALDSKSAKAALKNQQTQFSQLTNQTIVDSKN